MDGIRFDDLARKLASTTTRRMVLKTFATAVIGGVVSGRNPTRAGAEITCPDGRPPCDGSNGTKSCCDECSDCFRGRCSGKRCQPPATCANSQCVCPVQNQKCGLTCCDPALGLRCVKGVCLCADDRPPCSDKSGNPICCDGCSTCAGTNQGCRGKRCVSPQTCSNHQCICPAGKEICGAACCDPAQGMSCLDGKCQCEDGRDACTTTRGELVCCGECETCSQNGRGCRRDACPPPQTCSGTACVCPAGLTKCGSSCCDSALGMSCHDDTCQCADGRGACADARGALSCCSGCSSCRSGNRGCQAKSCVHPQMCSNNECQCPAGKSKCGSTCCDPSLGMTCLDGVCQCGDGRKACADSRGNLSCCKGCATCSENGRGCRENRCAPPQTCTNGECSCPQNGIVCGSTCCNSELGRQCVDGQCLCADNRPVCRNRTGEPICCNECSSCLAGGTGCSRNDRCLSPASCSGGSCTCPPGFSDCGPACCSTANCETCVDGSCQRTCSICELCDGAGNCLSACGNGRICRGGSCVCPGEAAACNGECCQECETCIGGVCAPSCGPCTECSDGACVSTCGECQICNGQTCSAAADGTVCDDHDPCTGEGLCLSGVCQQGSPLGCSTDDDPCTASVCESALGGCVTRPIEGCCSRDDQCVSLDICVSGRCDLDTHVCAFDPVDGCCTDDLHCEDGNPCSAGYCNPGTNRCLFIAVSGCCRANLDCDDGDPCTTEYCDLTTNTCVYSPIECVTCQICAGGLCVPVADETPCGVDQHCLNGACLPS